MHNYLHTIHTHCNQILYSIRYTIYIVLVVFEKHLISSYLSTKSLVKVFSKVILKVKSTRLMLHSVQEFLNFRKSVGLQE